MLVAFGLGILGAVAAFARLMQLFAATIDREVFSEQIAKLHRAGNLDRALKLCRAVPECAYAQMVEGAIRALQSASDRRDVDLASEVSAGFEEVRARWAERLARGRVLAFAALGLLIASGGAGMALRMPSPQVRLAALGVCAVGVVAALASLWREANLLGESQRAFQHHLLPVLTEPRSGRS